MIQFCIVVLFSTSLGGCLKIDIVSLNGLKYIQQGGNISLNCSFSSHESSTTAWFKQTPGEKPLLIASAYSKVEYQDEFNKRNRFNAFREKNSFTLNISNAETSDSATYYCAVSFYADSALGAWTVVVLKSASTYQYSVLQHPLLDQTKLGGNTTLQCSLLTESCSEDHTVYWFRHGSGESHPGIIYTHGNRNDNCKKSSETDFNTQRCVYKLPKRNLNLSDAGTYYCAVTMCGEIIFGKGTKLDFADNSVVDIAIILAASNIISMVVLLFLCKKLHIRNKKDAAEGCRFQVNQDACEALSYAAGSFINEPLFTRDVGNHQQFKDAGMYSQVIYYQQN